MRSSGATIGVRFALLSALLASIATGAAGAADVDCRSAALAVQVLGSGGPIADDDRAGASYLVWQRGRARVLVDAGGGSFVRFGEAGARIDQLELVALTHLHADHVSDLPALLKSGYFSGRRRALVLVGPNGSGHYPGTEEFIEGSFDPQRGTFRYLHGLIDGSDGLFPVQPRDVDARRDDAASVFDTDGVRVEAVGVHHGPVPALGYLVTVDGKRIAFSGDQNASRPGFAKLIQGADVLFMDHAIGMEAGEVAANLHAAPDAIGRLAARTGVRSLVLSHLMARSLKDRARNREVIAGIYHGPLDYAHDLMCVVLAR